MSPDYVADDTSRNLQEREAITNRQSWWTYVHQLIKNQKWLNSHKNNHMLPAIHAAFCFGIPIYISS